MSLRVFTTSRRGSFVLPMYVGLLCHVGLLLYGMIYELVNVSLCSVFESELAGVIPVVKTSIGGTRIIGRLCAGKGYECYFCLIF